MIGMIAFPRIWMCLTMRNELLDFSRCFLAPCRLKGYRQASVRFTHSALQQGRWEDPSDLLRICIRCCDRTRNAGEDFPVENWRSLLRSITFRQRIFL